ncbi:MAG: hypothetical protein O3B24_04235 [Verrucomicrobia bacterium]|nr:hypothetical protein [Verrucomicrobiota bacterium]
MNREQLEQQLLLAESGELSAAQARGLADWLAAHPDARALRTETNFLLTAARAGLPAPTPAADVRARIRAAAETELAQPAFVFPAVWLRGLAYAASLALAVAGWLWMLPTAPEDRIAQVHAMVAMAQGADEFPTPATVVNDQEAKLLALARDLLAMEGLTLDDTTYEVDGGAYEETTPDAEPAPTVLRLHSTPGLPAKRYG